jgi:hypothetical protein
MIDIGVNPRVHLERDKQNALHRAALNGRKRCGGQRSHEQVCASVLTVVARGAQCAVVPGRAVPRPSAREGARPAQAACHRVSADAGLARHRM